MSATKCKTRSEPPPVATSGRATAHSLELAPAEPSTAPEVDFNDPYLSDAEAVARKLGYVEPTPDATS